MLYRLLLVTCVVLALSVPALAQADLVLLDGKVVTMDPAYGEVEAVAIKGGRILDVGRDDAMRAHIGESTSVLDLEGRLVVPGFIEGHGHFAGMGEALMNLDLTQVRNWQEVIDVVERAVARAKPGEVISGRGWHQEKWDRAPEDGVEGFPTHHGVSAISPDNPVILTHASGHASFANQKAMDMSGISGDTPDPAGGEILRDANGAPIGIFRETAENLITVAPRMTRRERIARTQHAIELAAEECLANGVTSFQDAGSTFYVVDAIAEAARQGTLGVRLWVMIRERTELLEQYAPEYSRLRGVGDGFLTVGGLKRSLDGALGSRGAWLLDAYADSPESTGLATATLEDVEAMARIGLDNHLQICVHAIGDRANREILDLYERILTPLPHGRQLRWRVEHAQHLHPDDVPRFAELGVIASMQGIHCTSDAPWVLARLGPERAESGAYVWRDLLRSGAVVTNGTDAPVEDVDPIASFYATVTRLTKDGTPFYPDQRMTRMEALKSYTISAAYAAFEDDVKGSLTPGKYADLVVLTQDILTVPANQIPDTEVVHTIVGGRVAYSKP